MPKLIEAEIVDNHREKSIHVVFDNGKEAFLSRKLTEVLYNRNETYYFKVPTWYADKLGLKEFSHVKTRNNGVSYVQN